MEIEKEESLLLELSQRACQEVEENDLTITDAVKKTMAYFEKNYPSQYILSRKFENRLHVILFHRYSNDEELWPLLEKREKKPDH